MEVEQYSDKYKREGKGKRRDTHTIKYTNTVSLYRISIKTDLGISSRCLVSLALNLKPTKYRLESL